MLNEFFMSLREGGNAVGEVSRIPKTSVQPTIDAFAEQVISKIDNRGWKPIGSTGKKSSNGDIDLAFDTDLSLDDISAKLTELDIEHVVAKGLNEVNTKFPLYSPSGEMLEEFVQVDLMVGNLAWLELAFFTVPETETHYKAMHHTATLFGLLRGTDIENEDGSLTGWSMASTRGVFRRTSRKRINRNGKEVAESEKLSEYFPSPDVFCRVISELSEEPWTPEDLLDSCEIIWEKIRERYPMEIQGIIFKSITRWCENQEIEIPNFEMALQEALDHIITKEKLHQTHAEDMVLYGPEGVEFTLETFDHLISQLQTGKGTAERNLSVKIDGAPVVFAGRSFAHIQTPFVAAKAILAKDAKYATNEQELVELFGNRPGLLLKMRALLKYVTAVGFPEGECWRGDFLYSRDALQHINIEGKEYLAMHPNSLYYATPADSDLARRVEQAEIGVVWHTKYNGDDVSTAEPIYSTDVSELNDIPQVFQTDPYLRSIAGGTFSAEEFASLERLMQFARQSQEALAGDPQYDEILADEDFIKNFFMIFENHKVRTGAVGIDPTTFIPELMEWSVSRFNKKIAGLKTDKAKGSYEEKKAQFLKVLESRRETLLEMLDLMKDIAEIKDMFVEKLNHFGMFETFYKTLSDGQLHKTGQEGFVISDIIGNSLKLINRAEFSHLNFSADTENGWKTEAELYKEKISLPTFKKVDKAVDKMNWDIDEKEKGEEDLFNKSTLHVRGNIPSKERDVYAKEFQQVLDQKNVANSLSMKNTRPVVTVTDDIGQQNLEVKSSQDLKRSSSNEDSSEKKHLDAIQTVFNGIIEAAGGSVTLRIGSYTIKDAAAFEGVSKPEGASLPKGDFVIKNSSGQEIFWISHKTGTRAAQFQQYGGITEDKGHPEIKRFISKVQQFFPDGFPNQFRLWSLIKDSELALRAMYGPDWGSRYGINNVQVIIQGEMDLLPAGAGFRLTAHHIYKNGELAEEGYTPVLMARYDGGRNQGVPTCRLSISALAQATIGENMSVAQMLRSKG